MPQITRKNNATNPKKRMGDIPPSSPPDIEKTPGKAHRDKPGTTPDIPQIRQTHPKLDGRGDESAGRKPVRLASDR